MKDEPPATSRGKVMGIFVGIVLGALVLGGGAGGFYWYLSAPKPAAAASGTPAPVIASPAVSPAASPHVSPTTTATH
jgi:hypothetical protein